jgi:FdhD protein
MSNKFSISPTEIHRLRGKSAQRQSDFVSVEEPLEIQIIHKPTKTDAALSITMRTPGNDVALALGFLYTEGLIRKRSDVLEVQSKDNGEDNTLIVWLDDALEFDMSRLQRHFYTTSSCGVCGKSSLDAVQQQCHIELPKTQWKVDPELLYKLPQNLREVQSNFEQTGGLHGCALFDLKGSLLCSMEDVGRHNALDKLIGQILMGSATLKYSNTTLDLGVAEMKDSHTFNIPLSEHILLLSGRISFELVQKAAMAGIRFIAAVGAPSSLAIDLAEDMGITLVGFLRDERCNVYSHPHRIVLDL